MREPDQGGHRASRSFGISADDRVGHGSVLIHRAGGATRCVYGEFTEIVSPWRRAGVARFIAAAEVACEEFFNPVVPEVLAHHLRRLGSANQAGDRGTLPTVSNRRNARRPPVREG